MTYTVHTKPGCSYCDNAKVLLFTSGLAFVEVDYPTPERQAAFKNEYGAGASWPRIYQADRYVGGYSELAKELP